MWLLCLGVWVGDGVEWSGRKEGVGKGEYEMRWQKVNVLGVIRSQLPTSTANSRSGGRIDDLMRD